MVKRQVIRKVEGSLPVFEERTKWQTLEPGESASKIYHVMDDPLRLIIYEALDEGPVRQIDLARRVSRTTGKNYDVSAISHHVSLLEKAGLVASQDFSGRQTKVKMIYRIKDVRLQIYERPKLDVSPTQDDGAESTPLEPRQENP